MTNKSELTVNYKSTVINIISWIFGIIVLAIGAINMFWGNDLGFGIFLALLSFVFFPPVSRMITNWMGFRIPVILKILLAVFIIWAAVGVGELPEKIDMMLQDFSK